MPTFQPIEPFWKHGKQYVSFSFETKRNMAQVWEQVRKGWYGDSTWEGQEGRKAANCSKLVVHAIKEMDKWVVNDPVLSGSMRALVVPQSYLGCAPGYKGVVNDDGVEAEEALELSRELVLDPLPFVFSKSSREPCGHFEPVSYTHLTLPTTPYV